MAKLQFWSSLLAVFFLVAADYIWSTETNCWFVNLVIVNGQKNKLNVYFDNQADEAYTVNYISGALVKPDDFSTIVRNLSVYKYDLTIPAKQKIAIPYQFHSEFSPQDLGLTVIIDFSDAKKNPVRGIAYNGTVTVTDPEHSIFDVQLLFLYVVLAGLLAGVGYIIQQAFFSTPGKSKKTKKAAEKSVPAKHRDESGKMVLDESWIPEQHLKQSSSPKQSPKTRKRATRTK
ncbi:hypothetical protein INT43_007958 [Umbelopsis isabellina]|uniref:Translocon-associated protein subunit alpha n=1 Tax=Mortierella isabellina TaxID=91625 RepID=A0A8H7PQ95_MORIS|nr:hypothetical protein INT43_007958 [Umbelopsis isabellina]